MPDQLKAEITLDVITCKIRDICLWREIQFPD